MSDTLTSYCRLCAESKPYSKLVNLQIDEDRRRKILYKLDRLSLDVNLSSSDDTFPPTVCLPCINLLDTAIDFIISVEKAQGVLSEVALVRNIKREPSDSEQFYDSCDESIVKKEDGVSDPVIADISCNISNNCVTDGGTERSERDSHTDSTPLSQLRSTWKEEECQKELKSKGGLDSHLPQDTEKKGECTCDKCGKCFTAKNELTDHMLSHEDNRPHKCEICKQTFRYQSWLRRHMEIHGGEKPFSCNLCGRRFRLEKLLKSHSIIHTDSLPYNCSYCQKSFRFKSILSQHLRQHTGVKPYSCQVCQRDFTNWPNYNKHMKRAHNMDMSKKKRIPDVVCPTKPPTRKVIQDPDAKSIELKKKILTGKTTCLPRLLPKPDRVATVSTPSHFLYVNIKAEEVLQE